MGSLNWPREEWKAKMAKVDSMKFTINVNVKLKYKYTSIERRRISIAITSGRCRLILPMFSGRKFLKQAS